MRDIVIITFPATVVGTIQADEVEVINGWLYFYLEGLERRNAFPYSNPAYDRVNISPAGIAYPGDSSPGNGSKHLSVSLTTGGTTLMNQVEDVDLTKGGWLYIIKGDHIVLISRRMIVNLTIEQST